MTAWRSNRDYPNAASSNVKGAAHVERSDLAPFCFVFMQFPHRLSMQSNAIIMHAIVAVSRASPGNFRLSLAPAPSATRRVQMSVLSTDRIALAWCMVPRLSRHVSLAPPKHDCLLCSLHGFRPAGGPF